MLITIPRKGTFVRKITSEYIEEVFPIRANLEALAARLAISHLEANDLKKMKLVLNKMVKAAEKMDLKSYIKHHYLYHQIYASATKNRTLIEILENLRRQAIWFLFSSPYDQENYEYGIDAHKKILDLFIKKDTRKVETLVMEHIMTSYNKFLPIWQSKSSENL